MTTSPRVLRRTLAIYAFMLACVIVFTVGIILAQQDHKATSGQVLAAIGLNLVASVIFAVSFTLLSGWVQQRALEDNLQEGLQEFSHAFLKNVTELNPTYIPTAVYPASETFGLDFNRDISKSLGETSTYYFRGPSARYVPARLRASPRQPQHVRIAMLDPRETLALSRRSADRRFWERSRGKTIEQLQQEMYEELYMTVVALFDYRRICNVEIIYLSDPSVYRFELFDDSLYFSWYHSPMTAGKELPETYRFSSKSFLYQILQQDTSRRFEVSTHKHVFHPGHDDENLTAHLTELSGHPVTAADLTAWRTAYVEYTREFTAFLTQFDQT